MDSENSNLKHKQHADFRLCSISGYMTELLEIHVENPTMHILVIPGNPGVVTFYKDFIESLYELLRGSVSVTAVGHISHTMTNWEHGRLFSLQNQIEHKVDFISYELKDVEVPIVLVGHSIGSYIAIEMFKRKPEKVIFCVGLYPFLFVNKESLVQSIIGRITVSPALSGTLSSIAASLRYFPSWASRFLLKLSLGRSWSVTAVNAAYTYFLQYHTLRNMLFMAMTEFEKLSEMPDWEFIRVKQGQIAFLFGMDDHWGPLSMYEEISKQVADVAITIEREGHTHAFCCTEAGSLWVAEHVASLIKNRALRS